MPSPGACGPVSTGPVPAVGADGTGGAAVDETGGGGPLPAPTGLKMMPNPSADDLPLLGTAAHPSAGAGTSAQASVPSASNTLRCPVRMSLGWLLTSGLLSSGT